MFYANISSDKNELCEINNLFLIFYMKTRIIIYLTILVVGIGFFIFYFNPTWSPWYCSHFSGSHSNAWGPAVEECEKVGCKIQKIRDFDIPNTFDASGFEFKCVKK